MKLDILQEAIERCLDEMFRYSQPSTTWEELLNMAKEEVEKTGKPQPVHERYYLSQLEYKYILEKYLHEYNLMDHFKDHCDLIINDMEKGCSKDKYIEPDGDKPGYRSYEEVPPLSEIIGKDASDKVIEFITTRRDFYRTDRKESQFRFNVMNYSPYSNREKVIDYWKSQGIDLEIEDRTDEDEIWTVHHYGMTWDEYRKENSED